MRAKRFRRVAFSLGAFTLLLPLAGGCGAGKGNVSGTVTLDGKPLPSGTIAFYPAKKSLGNPIIGPITDGKYSVSGVPAGNLKVTVETSTIKQQADTLLASRSTMSMSMKGRTKDLPAAAKKQMDEEKKSMEEANRKGKELMDKYRQIPDKYEKKDTTTLSAEVKAGANIIDFPLTSK